MNAWREGGAGDEVCKSAAAVACSLERSGRFAVSGRTKTGGTAEEAVAATTARAIGCARLVLEWNKSILNSNYNYVQDDLLTWLC